jgi:hypothetical protein
MSRYRVTVRPGCIFANVEGPCREIVVRLPAFGNIWDRLVVGVELAELREDRCFI